MAPQTLSYMVAEIPDPFYSRYRQLAEGDVRRTIWGDWERLARTLGTLPPQGLTASITAFYTPVPEKGDVQSRLRFYVSATTEREELLNCFRLLCEQGTISRFYELKKARQPQWVTKDFPAVWEITRRTDNLEPLFSPEYNDRIPEYYYLIQPFEPGEENDLMALDAILNMIGEPVVVELSITPADIRQEVRAHTQYLARLASINRNWSHDDTTLEWSGEEIYGIRQGSAQAQKIHKIRPLRCEDPLADSVLRVQRRFHEELRKPHISFSFRVYAMNPDIARLVAIKFAESAFSEDSFRIRCCAEKDDLQVNNPYSSFSRLPWLATVGEIKAAFRLPIASLCSPLCIRKNTDPVRESTEDTIVFGLDQELSTPLGSGSPVVGQSPQGMVKHTFIAGMSGYGKSTLVQHILLQLHSKNIPFLVFESVKTEYRVLSTLRGNQDSEARSLAADLEVYTPGNDSISPFRHNPLESCPGIGRDEHIGTLSSCFQGAFAMIPPLPPLLEEALERVYERHDLVENPPLVSDLVDTALEVLREKGYAGEQESNLLAALTVRFGSLTRGSTGTIFQSRLSIPSMRKLAGSWTVLELEQLSPEKAALLTLFLLVNLREHLITTRREGKVPRLVIVIEEAHILVGRTGPARASEEMPDPKAFAAEAICRMLMEFRASGVGVIIVDQHPSTVAQEVIKATSTKVAFLQVDESDRQDLGAAMLFGPLEMEEIARLKTGEAFFYTEGLYGPRKIKTIDLHAHHDLSTPIIREEVLKYIAGDKWFVEAAKARAIMDLLQTKEAMDRYEQLSLENAYKIQQLSEFQIYILSHDPKYRWELLTRLRSDAFKLRKTVVRHYETFFKGRYHAVLLGATQTYQGNETACSLHEALKVRFEEAVVPGFQKSIQLLDNLLRACSFKQRGIAQ